MAEGDFDTEGLVRNNLARMRLAAVTVLELIEDMWTCKDETAFLVRKRAVELARLVGQHRILPSARPDGDDARGRAIHGETRAAKGPSIDYRSCLVNCRVHDPSAMLPSPP